MNYHSVKTNKIIRYQFMSIMCAIKVPKISVKKKCVS